MVCAHTPFVCSADSDGLLRRLVFDAERLACLAQFSTRQVAGRLAGQEPIAHDPHKAIRDSQGPPAAPASPAAPCTPGTAASTWPPRTTGTAARGQTQTPPPSGQGRGTASPVSARPSGGRSPRAGPCLGAAPRPRRGRGPGARDSQADALSPRLATSSPFALPDWQRATSYRRTRFVASCATPEASDAARTDNLGSIPTQPPLCRLHPSARLQQPLPRRPDPLAALRQNPIMGGVGRVHGGERRLVLDFRVALHHGRHWPVFRLIAKSRCPA